MKFLLYSVDGVGFETRAEAIKFIMRTYGVSVGTALDYFNSQN